MTLFCRRCIITHIQNTPSTPWKPFTGEMPWKRSKPYRRGLHSLLSHAGGIVQEAGRGIHLAFFPLPLTLFYGAWNKQTYISQLNSHNQTSTAWPLIAISINGRSHSFRNADRFRGCTDHANWRHRTARYCKFFHVVNGWPYKLVSLPLRSERSLSIQFVDAFLGGCLRNMMEYARSGILRKELSFRGVEISSPLFRSIS